jgi:hypothetical protein
MKKILLIFGSPHQTGPTAALTDACLAGLGEEVAITRFDCFAAAPHPCDDCRICHTVTRGVASKHTIFDRGVFDSCKLNCVRIVGVLKNNAVDGDVFSAASSFSIILGMSCFATADACAACSIIRI